MSINGAGIFTVQWDNVVGPAGRIFDVQMRESLPAAAKTDNLDIVLAAAVSHALDDRVEAWHVAAASEDADALFRHVYPLYWPAVITTAAGSCFLKMFLLPAICRRRHFRAFVVHATSGYL